MLSLKRNSSAIVLVALLILMDFSFVRANDLPESAYVTGVIGHPQSYSISCEARSAVDLAAFWGINIGETEFLHSLPSSDNPDEGYVGNPNEVWGRTPPNGYGVHAAPVAETLRTYGLQAEAHRDLSWDDLRAEISAGRPVILWVIGAMWSGTPEDYHASDGTVSRVAAFEHTMILTGYSPNSVQVIDAASGQYQYYWQSDFLQSWSVLGNMAVFASGSSQQLETSVGTPAGETYTVQPGDYLMELARQFRVTWQELANLNSIFYPYTIFAGQVLQLPAGSTHPAIDTPEPDTVPVKPATGNFKARLPVILYGSTPPAGSAMVNEPQTASTVTVLHTDTLIGFGRSIGIAWHILAKLNNLPPTYVVHPGEILRVK